MIKICILDSWNQISKKYLIGRLNFGTNPVQIIKSVGWRTKKWQQCSGGHAFELPATGEVSFNSVCIECKK